MKYMGSKSRIAKYIVPIIQKYVDESGYDCYVESMVGGGNVIDKIKAPVKIGYDINKYLIALLNQAQTDCSVFPDTYDEEFYQLVKNNKEAYPDWLVGLVGFSTFGAKWWGGYPRDRKGNRDIVAESIRNIKKQSENLKGILFLTLDYLETNHRNTVIYNDPPYKLATGYGTKFNYEAYYDWCRKQRDNGCIVLCSEYEMPDDFKCIWEKEYSVNFDANRTTKQERVEKLFVLE